MRRRLGTPAFATLFTLALLAAVSAQEERPVKRFITADGERPTGLFAPGVMVGDTVYIAGKGDYRPDADLDEKVNNCMNEIRKTLQMAGLDLEHVVKAFVYLEDHEAYEEFNRHYAAFFPEAPPARTTLGVSEVPGPSRLEITCIAYADPDRRKVVGEPPAGFPFSPGILAGETLYVSGKGDQLPGGGHPERFEDQVRQALWNVEATLKEAGLDLSHVVKSHVFLDDPEQFETAGRVYAEFFEEGAEPACEAVLVDWIPGGSHVEITCVATTDRSSRRVVSASDSGAPAVEGPIPASPAVWAGDTLYLSARSGLAERDEPGSIDLETQVHRMARRQVATLDAAGLTLEDIVSGCVYLRVMDDYQPMNAIYHEYFSKGPGVRTCLTPSAHSSRPAALVWASFIAADTR